MPFGHFDPRYADDRWWGFLWWLVPLLFIALVVGLVVWAVTRSAPRPSAPPLPPGWIPPRPPAGDPALEQARLRYAKGELSREEFLRMSEDLGGGAGGRPPAAGEEGPG